MYVTNEELSAMQTFLREKLDLWTTLNVKDRIDYYEQRLKDMDLEFASRNKVIPSMPANF